MATREEAKEVLKIAKAIQEDIDKILQKPCPLTLREKEILYLVASGLSYVQISQRLKIVESTVKNHMKTVLRKLDAKDKTYAVVLSLQNGWIEFPAEK